MPKLLIQAQVDTVHGESDGTPYHWRVWWVREYESGLVERVRLIRQGRCRSAIAARLMVRSWVRAASEAGPNRPVDPCDALRRKL